MKSVWVVTGIVAAILIFALVVEPLTHPEFYEVGPWEKTFHFLTDDPSEIDSNS